MNIPPEAVVPLLCAIVALMVLIFAGDKLSAWKVHSPKPARRFGMAVALVLFVATAYFLLIKIPNQSDPNNAGTNNLSLFDAPMIGFFAAVGALFWRFADQRRIGFWMGVVVGVVLIAKPYMWPVISTYSYMDGGKENIASHSRDFLSPEHYLFLLSGIVAMVCGWIAKLPLLDELPAIELAKSLPQAQVVASRVD